MGNLGLPVGFRAPLRVAAMVKMTTKKPMETAMWDGLSRWLCGGLLAGNTHPTHRQRITSFLLGVWAIVVGFLNRRYVACYGAC